MPDSRAATSLHRLNEKEREVLRLLGRGHDAKSSASALGLSVHTVNERLRAARRKLDVTSSREAARHLLEWEGATYEKLGSKQLGEATDGPLPDPDTSDAFPHRHALWIGGLFVMLTMALAAAVLVSNPASSGDRPAGDPVTPLEAAQLAEFERVARAWLALVDQEDWEASFAAAGESFRKPNTVKTWREASQMARVPLGAVVERRKHRAEFVNAPPRGFVVMEFRTDFDARPGAREKVTLEHDPDGWKVVAYVID